MSDKIEYNDIFNDDLFSKGIDGVEKLTNSFKEMASTIGGIVTQQKELLNNFKVKNSEDIKRLNEELAKAAKNTNDLNAANKAVAQGEIELAKLRQQQAKALQEEEKAAQQRLKTKKLANNEKNKPLTLYQQESKLLRDLKNEYKNVALAEGQTSKAAQDLLAKITPLDAKLKALDKTTGDNFRNVGNYASAFDGLKSSLTNVLGAAGIGLGLAEGFSFLKESFAEFQKAEKATKDLDFALRNIGGEGTIALEKLSNQAAQLEQNLGLFEAEDIQNLQKELVNLGASSTQVEALTPKILDLAKATGMDLATATDVSIKAINGQTKGLKAVGLEFEDTGDRTQNYNILLEKLDKFQGAAAASSETLEGKQQRLAIAYGNIKESVGEFLTNFGTELLNFYDELTGKVTIFENTINKVNPVFEANAKAILKAGTSQKALNELQERALAISKDTTLSDTERYEKLLIVERQQKAITNALNEQALAQKRNQNVILNSKIGGDTKKEQEDYYAKYKAEQEKLRQIDAENDVIVEEKAKEHNKTLEEIEADRIADELQFSAIQYEKNKKLDEEESERKKKQREEDLKNLFDLSNKALDIAAKEISDREKLIQDSLDKDIEQRNNNIEEQKRRAEQGLENTLAFEEQALKEVEAKKESEAKKAIKREKEIAFFKLLSANAEKDPNSALQKTITEMLLGNAIAGAFFEGTEKVENDLKGNKVHNGRDGYVVAVDGSERVLTGEQNKLIGNLSNDELANLAHDYNNKLLPNYMISQPIGNSISDNIYSSLQLKQMVEFTNEVKELKEIIKNRPVGNTSLDGLGNVITSLTQNGFTKTTKEPLTRGY